jgi:hypothetical protein
LIRGLVFSRGTTAQHQKAHAQKGKKVSFHDHPILAEMTALG